MNNIELKNIIKDLYGNLILIGKFPDQINELINKNDKILKCEHLSNEINSGTIKTKRSKEINIRKIKKRYKKKKNDFIICNTDDIYKYRKSFIKNSLYINKNVIYIFGKKEQIKEIKIRYKRYVDNIEEKHLKEVMLLKIKSDKIPSKIKNIGYEIYDTTIEIIDAIGDILTS